MGLEKATKTNGFCTIRGLKASPGGIKQQDQQEEQQEGPKGPITIFGLPTSGHLWPQEAPKWGPRASQEDPLRGAKKLQNLRFFNDSWFGSKARWHQATRPTRRAPRGPVRALGRSVPRRKSPKRPSSGAQGPPRRTLAGCKKVTKT